MKKYIFQKIADTIITMMFYVKDQMWLMWELFAAGLILDNTAYYYGIELN